MEIIGRFPNETFKVSNVSFFEYVTASTVYMTYSSGFFAAVYLVVYVVIIYFP